MTRRQLSLYLSDPERSQVDALRSKLDPKQFGIIPAHITLCREPDVEDWEAVWQCVEELEIFCIELTISQPVLSNEGSILLPVEDDKFFSTLRDQLLDNPKPLTPHITLLHPRNKRGSQADLAMARETTLPESVRLREITMIEQVDGGK